MRKASLQFFLNKPCPFHPIWVCANELALGKWLPEELTTWGLEPEHHPNLLHLPLPREEKRCRGLKLISSPVANDWISHACLMNLHKTLNDGVQRASGLVLGGRVPKEGQGISMQLPTYCLMNPSIWLLLGCKLCHKPAISEALSWVLSDMFSQMIKSEKRIVRTFSLYSFGQKHRQLPGTWDWHLRVGDGLVGLRP